MGNELAVQAILEQARSHRASRDRNKLMFMGIMQAGQAIGAGLAQLGNNLKKEKERAEEEEDIRNIMLAEATGPEIKTMKPGVHSTVTDFSDPENIQEVTDLSSIGPAQEVPAPPSPDRPDLGVTPGGRAFMEKLRVEKLQEERFRREDERFEKQHALQVKGAERAAAAIDRNVTLDTENKKLRDAEEKRRQERHKYFVEDYEKNKDAPQGSGMWKLLDMSARGQKLNPEQQDVLNSSITALRNKAQDEGTEPSIKLPSKMAEILGADADAVYPLSEALRLGTLAKAAESLEEEVDGVGQTEKQQAESLAEMLNSLIEVNDLKYPHVKASALMDSAARTAITNSIGIFGQNQRKQAAASDIADYRNKKHALDQQALNIRKAQFNMTVDDFRNTAAEKELEAIYAELEQRDPTAMLDMSKTFDEVLKPYPRLHSRWLKAIEVGMRARAEMMGAQGVSEGVQGAPAQGGAGTPTEGQKGAQGAPKGSQTPTPGGATQTEDEGLEKYRKYWDK